jgi:signal transduction histidine kinase
MILCSVHLLMNLKLAPVLLAAGSAIGFMILYYFVRFKKCQFIPKLLITLLGLILLDLSWYSKFLSNGPVLFFILIFGALIIWVWEGKTLELLMSYYFINIVLLFIIDYNAPEILKKYESLQIRSVDIFLSFSLYSLLLFFLLIIVKKEFIRQKDMAVKSDKLKSAFLANMSHEIRTPMNAIVGFSQLLEDEPEGEEKQRYISIIQNSSEHLLQLVSEILDLSKIEAGEMVLKYSDFSINDVFLKLKDSIEIDLLRREKTNIKVEYSLPQGDIIVHSDLIRLEQVLSNLLSNAIKFTIRGTISLSCIKKNKDIVFSVSDTGTGIPEEDQKEIFNRFTRFNYLGLNTEGTGIGLSIVERIVTLLKGEIWIQSVVNKGTTFYFSLPYTYPDSFFIQDL